MGTQREIIHLELNRVEGDLEVKVEYDGERITNAWCVGTMYRGFEQMLKGRAATDGLVVTPRICGICGTAHHYVAAAAVEMAWGAAIAPNGQRVRNLCLMAEEVQSDARHTFLMFTIDLCHARYAAVEGYDEVMARFEPFHGELYVQALKRSQDILKVVAQFGGQWPHATYMVPGGVTINPPVSTLLRARTLVDGYQKWYEQAVLGCSVERWMQNESADDVEAWLDEAAAHQQSAVGVFWRFARRLGLHRTGVGEGNLLSFGSCYDPEGWQPPFGEPVTLMKAGFRDAATQQDLPFEQRNIVEHVKHSWFVDYGGGRHPFSGETQPQYLPEGEAYSWAKAPRYGDKVAEVGPFAALYHDGDALIRGLFAEEGSNTFTRQLARLHRPVRTLQRMRQTIDEMLSNLGEPFIIQPKERPDGEGFGVACAARGALAHWIKIRDGKIDRYQVITPTTWNASPRDSAGRLGHWERTMIGTEVQDINDPIELAHVVRSHDACLVCTVHVLDTDHRHRFSLF